MFKFLARCVAFILGLLAMADAALPTRVEQLTLDQHTSSTRSGPNGRGVGDSDYTLHFVGGVVNTCTVGHTLYTKLKDGERLEVRSSRLFKSCTRIAQGDEVVLDDQYWKIFKLVAGALLLAVAFGWVRDDGDEDRSGWGVRLG